MAETQALDFARLRRGNVPRNHAKQCQDLACWSAAALSLAAALLFRKSAQKAKKRHAALLQEIESQQAAFQRLEAEYKQLLAQHASAETKVNDFTLVATRAESQLEKLQNQLSEKTQEYEQLLQTVTFERNKAVSELQVASLSLDHAKNEYSAMYSESKRVLDDAKTKVKELEDRASAARADTDKVRRKLNRKEAELHALRTRYPGQIQSEADSPMTARSIDSNASSTPFSRQALREINSAAEQSPQLGFERKAKPGANAD